MFKKYLGIKSKNISWVGVEDDFIEVHLDSGYKLKIMQSISDQGKKNLISAVGKIFMGMEETTDEIVLKFDGKELLLKKFDIECKEDILVLKMPDGQAAIAWRNQGFLEHGNKLWRKIKNQLGILFLKMGKKLLNNKDCK